MTIWSAEIKELEKLYESFRGQFPDLEKELQRLVKAEDENMILLYSRRCLEVIITDLCDCELNRERGTEPLKGIIDKLNKERKVPSHILTSMQGLNELSTYGTHPKDFDPEQVKPVLNNLSIIMKWYLKYKEIGKNIKSKSVEEIREEIKSFKEAKKSIIISRKKFAGLLGGLIGIVASVFAVLYFSNIIDGSKQIKELEKSIAVLPFINESPVDSNKHFINGVMEEILNNLQAIKEFRVLARTSTSQYQDLNRPTIPEIAKKLRVSYIVEGSGQKYGNIFTLRVQLIRAKGKETHLWGKTYNEEIREVGDYVRIQSEVAQAIAAELKVAITPEERQLIEKAPTSNLTAHDFYWRGREALLKYFLGNNDWKELKKAEDLSRKALTFDSTFANAYANLSLIYLLKYGYNETAYFSDNYLDSALILADRSLYYDDKISDAYFAKGVYYFSIGEVGRTLQEFDKALKYNESYWQVYSFRGVYIYFSDVNNQDYVKAIEDLTTVINLNRGRELPELLRQIGDIFVNAGFVEKGMDYYNEALTLDQDSLSYFHRLASLETSYGNYEKAINFYKKCFAADSNNTEVLKGLGEDYMNLKQFKESLKYFNKAVELLKGRGNLILSYSHRIAYTYWMNGLKEEAKIFFNDQIKYCEESINLKRAYATSLWAYYDLAGVMAFHGEKQKAYENLNIFNKRKIFPKWFMTLIKNDPLFDTMRNEPEFQKMVKDMDARYQAEHERLGKWLEEQGML